MNRVRRFLTAAVVLPAAVGVIAYAAATDEQKCLASKLKALGKYEACLFKGYALHIIKSTPTPDFTKCSSKFSLDWSKAETRYGGSCPTTGDGSTVAGLAETHAAEMFDLLNGVEPVCGNDLVEEGEDCDGNDLAGATCESIGYLGGTLACNSSCDFDEAACFHCVPGDCVDAGATCGPVGDGCGDTIPCGDCTPPQQCGWGGNPSACGGLCEPGNCFQYGAQCGQLPDGCGGVVTCDTCPDGQVCMGIPPTCETGTSCTALDTATACGSRNCGFASNGCGGLVECGVCASGEGCIYSTGTCSASAPCIPATCADLAADESTTSCNASGGPAAGCFCGLVADGCGNLLDCGSCAAGEHCGSGGPNVCD